MEKNIDSLANQIVKNYFICKNQFAIKSFSNGEVDYQNPFYIFYRDVELAYSLLNKEEKLIIENEYFFNTNPTWWRSFYGPKAYQLKKEQAVLKFVRYFHEIH